MFWHGKLSAAIKFDAAQVEVYSTGRYLTVTGHRIAGTSAEIRASSEDAGTCLSRPRRDIQGGRRQGKIRGDHYPVRDRGLSLHGIGIARASRRMVRAVRPPAVLRSPCPQGLAGQVKNLRLS